MVWGAIAAGAADFAINQHSANQAWKRSQQAAREHRMWLQQMSNTSHQRQVADMRAAGLNPILSATGGSGASTPGGAMASGPAAGTTAVSTALAARRQQQEIKNLEATESKTKAETDLIKNKETMTGVPADVVGGVRDLLERNRGKVGDAVNGWLRRTGERIGNSARSVRDWYKKSTRNRRKALEVEFNVDSEGRIYYTAPNGVRMYVETQ